jgi:metallo-beta-lactamase class B
MKYLCLLLLLLVISPVCQAQDVIRISGDLELIKISDNSYIHVSWSDLPDYGRVSANGLVLIDGNEAFLFDTPWNDSLTCILVSYLEEQMKLRIQGFIPNHWHEDCMGGLDCIKSHNIKSYANQLTIDIARSKGLPVPDEGFTDSLALRLGDRIIYCWYPGPAHSMDNIVVWLPSEKILFPGCICKSLDSRNLGNTADGDVTSYPETVDRIIDRFKEAEIIIPGHGSSGDQELLIHTRALCDQYL